MKSRLPQIERKLPAAVNAAVKDAADRIASKAAATAPVRHGDLKESLGASDAVRPVVGEIRGRPTAGYGVYAQWYWFLVEFGHNAGGPGPRGGVTGKAAPHPFMIPAAEAERPRMVADVKRALGNL